MYQVGNSFSNWLNGGNQILCYICQGRKKRRERYYQFTHSIEPFHTLRLIFFLSEPRNSYFSTYYLRISFLRQNSFCHPHRLPAWYLCSYSEEFLMITVENMKSNSSLKHAMEILNPDLKS